MKSRSINLDELGSAARTDLLRAMETAKLIFPLFYWGNLDLLASDCIISMAGSREASPWSLTVMEALAGQITAQGSCIVSGGAIGTDVAVHRGALQSGGNTIFVLPCPLQDVTPDNWRPELRGLIDRKRVLFLSPFAPRTTVTRSNPIIRNRLIVALSTAAVAGETGIQGGTNHFLHCALSWGVPAFVLDIGSSDEQLRTALTELQHRGAFRFAERDALQSALAKRIVATAKATAAKRREQDGQQLRLCEDEEFYATGIE